MQIVVLFHLFISSACLRVSLNVMDAHVRWYSLMIFPIPYINQSIKHNFPLVNGALVAAPDYYWELQISLDSVRYMKLNKYIKN